MALWTQYSFRKPRIHLPVALTIAIAMNGMFLMIVTTSHWFALFSLFFSYTKHLSSANWPFRKCFCCHEGHVFKRLHLWTDIFVTEVHFYFTVISGNSLKLVHLNKTSQRALMGNPSCLTQMRKLEPTSLHATWNLLHGELLALFCRNEEANAKFRILFAQLRIKPHFNCVYKVAS